MLIIHKDPRCKFCKFWERKTAFEFFDSDRYLFKEMITEHTPMDPDKQWKKAVDVIPTSPMGICLNENFVYTQAGGVDNDDLKAALKNNKALLYSDGEAYGAYFYTCENFGCIHHESIKTDG
jgi:hypothetical protein